MLILSSFSVVSSLVCYVFGMVVVMCTHVWVFNFVSLVYMYFSVPMSFVLLLSVIRLEIWYGNGHSSSTVLLAQDCFEFYDIFSTYVKNVMGILIRIALNLYAAFCRMLLFTKLILPIHKHEGVLSIFYCLSESLSSDI